MVVLKRFLFLIISTLSQFSFASNTNASKYFLTCVKATSESVAQKISCKRNIDYDKTNYNIQSVCQKATNKKYPNFFDLNGTRDLNYAMIEEGQFVTETSIKGYEIIKDRLGLIEKNCELSKELRRQSRRKGVLVHFFGTEGLF